MATVYDVAEKAGVSIATVSRAMRGQDSVTAEARDRVLAAARELGYRPNRLAQTLARPAENTLGIMLPSDFTHPFYAMLTDEMTKSALAHSYDVVIGVSGRPTVEGFVDAATDLEDRRITGMLLCGNAEAVAGYVDTRRPEAPPTVLVGGIAGAGLPLVSVDEEQGGYDATRYLIEAGHERIGFLGLTANTYRTNGREHGYTRAIEEAGLEPAMRGVVVTMDAGRREVCAMMQEHSDLTALVAFNDAVALGAIRGLADAGLRVPEDVSVIGFDDIPQGRYSVPALTTVGVPVEEMARQAVHMLAALIEPTGDGPNGGELFLEPELQIRDSVRLNDGV